MQKPAIEGGIPTRDTFLPFSPPDIRQEEVKSVIEVLKSKWITRGKRCKEFEDALAHYTGASHAVVLNSATAGLFLSLLIQGIGEGDEVITTPYTFAATANVVLHSGARPVFADIDPDTFLISPDEILRRITPRTKALLPVHFAGHPVDKDTIEDIAKTHKLIIIEDAAHAIGAEYRGKKIGNGEHLSVFSFHAVKNLTTAEGGAVTTNDKKLSDQLKLYSLHGQTKDAYSKQLAGGWKYDIRIPGYKFNMTDIQAAMGIEQLMRLDENRKRREKIAKRYSSFFKKYNFIKIPRVKVGITHAWHLYPLQIDFTCLKIDRDRFIMSLAAENISSNVHFIPLHTMSYYRKLYHFKPYDFPSAYSTFIKEVSLPIYPGMLEKDIQDVIEGCRKVLTYYKK